MPRYSKLIFFNNKTCKTKVIQLRREKNNTYDISQSQDKKNLDRAHGEKYIITDEKTTNSNFLILYLSNLLPDDENLRHFKLRLFDLTEFIV